VKDPATVDHQSLLIRNGQLVDQDEKSGSVYLSLCLLKRHAMETNGDRKYLFTHTLNLGTRWR
jgi:hypothetical protein